MIMKMRKNEDDNKSLVPARLGKAFLLFPFVCRKDTSLLISYVSLCSKTNNYIRVQKYYYT